MSALFLEHGRSVFFLSFSPHPFNLRMISSMVALAPHGEMAKTLLVSVDAVVGVELLATTLAGKHMATVLPNFVQILESFVTDITGLSPFSLLCFVPPH